MQRITTRHRFDPTTDQLRSTTFQYMYTVLHEIFGDGVTVLQYADDAARRPNIRAKRFQINGALFNHFKNESQTEIN